MTAIAHVPLAPRKTPCGSFTAPGLHIDGAAFEWLRAYLQREEARPPQGRAEEDVGHTSETGSTSDSLEGTDLSSPSLSSRARPTECDGAVPLSRPMSHDERLYEMDSVDIGQGTYKRRRKVRLDPKAPCNSEFSMAAAGRATPAPSLPLADAPCSPPLLAAGRLEFDRRPRHPGHCPPPRHAVAPHRRAVPRAHLGRRSQPVAQAAEDSLARRL